MKRLIVMIATAVAHGTRAIRSMRAHRCCVPVVRRGHVGRATETQQVTTSVAWTFSEGSQS